jgi:hypothetical protein
LRTSATLHFVSDLSPTQRLGKRGGFSKVSKLLAKSIQLSKMMLSFNARVHTNVEKGVP